jgi:drug/metabolite transporter (DMT)-like permease
VRLRIHPPREESNVLSELSLVAAAAIWGFTFPLVKDALGSIGPFEFLAVRFTLATLVLAVMWPRAAREALRTGRRAGLVVGGLLALGHWFQTAGLQYTQSTNAGFITGLYVVFTPLIGWIFLRRHVSRAVFVGIVLTTIGLGLLSLRVVGGHIGTSGGDLLVLGCAVAYGGQIVAVGHFAPDSDTRVLLIQQLAITALACAVVMPVEHLVVPRGWVVWNALLATALGSSVFGIGVQVWAQKRISPSRAAVIFAAEAPFAALFGHLLAHERLGGRAWMGAVLIFTGMLIVAIKPAPATQEA